MVTDLRAALSAELQTLSWMTPPTRKAAQEKLEAILQKIGYPATWRDYGPVKVD